MVDGLGLKAVVLGEAVSGQAKSCMLTKTHDLLILTFPFAFVHNLEL